MTSATVDHLYHIDDPRRQQPGGAQVVLSCKKCNERRGYLDLWKYRYGIDFNDYQRNKNQSMNITITLEASPTLLDALNRIVNSLAPAKATNPLTSVPKEPEAPKPSKPSKPVPAPVMLAEVPSSTDTISTTTLTIEQVREKAKATGKEIVKAALTAFGVERLTELKPEQYGDFMQKIQAA